MWRLFLQLLQQQPVPGVPGSTSSSACPTWHRQGWRGNDLFIQAAIVILFICGFAYSWSKNCLFQTTNPPISALHWSFYSRIRNLWSNISRTYLPRITRETCTMKLGYNELGYNEHILNSIGHFIAQTNPVKTKSGDNGQKWPVPSCSL